MVLKEAVGAVAMIAGVVSEVVKDDRTMLGGTAYVAERQQGGL